MSELEMKKFLFVICEKKISKKSKIVRDRKKKKREEKNLNGFNAR
jgi:hypothetical protein